MQPTLLQTSTSFLPHPNMAETTLKVRVDPLMVVRLPPFLNYAAYGMQFPLCTNILTAYQYISLSIASC